MVSARPSAAASDPKLWGAPFRGGVARPSPNAGPAGPRPRPSRPQQREAPDCQYPDLAGIEKDQQPGNKERQRRHAQSPPPRPTARQRIRPGAEPKSVQYGQSLPARGNYGVRLLIIQKKT